MNGNDTRRWLIAKLYSVGFSEEYIRSVLRIRSTTQAIDDDFLYAAQQYMYPPQGEYMYQSQLRCLVQLLSQLQKDTHETRLIGILCQSLKIDSLSEFMAGALTLIYQQSHIDIPTKNRRYGDLLEAVIEMPIMRTTERLHACVHKDQLCMHIVAYAQALLESGDAIPRNKQELKYSLITYLASQYQGVCVKIMSWQWISGVSSAKIALLFGKYLDSDEINILTQLFGLGRNEPIDIQRLASVLGCSPPTIEARKEEALEKLREQNFLEQVLSH